MTPSPYDARTFEEFWPHYLRLHSRPETQAMHAVATLTALALVATALATRRPWLLGAAVLADYAIAQTSHRVFEKNRTTPWKNHAWHVRAELRLLRLVLMRKRDELAAPSRPGTRWSHGTATDPDCPR